MDFDFSTETITPDTTNLITIGGTGGFELPLGTTAQRPVAGLDNGAMRYNTDLNVIEGYVNSSWTPMATGSTSITLTGDITGSGTSPIATTLATVNANTGQFAVATFNGKGLATAATNLSVTGDATGTSSGAGLALTLATVNSNTGTFASVTVNGKGLVTAAANLSGDITTSGSVSTLATVNANVGTFTALTVNAKGLVTAATNLAATGDATGTASGSSIALTLATVNASPQTDTFRKITVNGKGLVTATSAVGSSDITTALGYTPVNKAGDTMSGTLNMGANVISNLGSPVAGTDATNKNYVDSAIAGLSWKQSVRVATTTNGTLATAFANGQTVDGITLVTGDRILIKNQTTQTENGIYIVQASGAPVRSTDADTGAELVGASVFVDLGTANADTGWVQTTNAPITIGSSNIIWAQFSGSGSYTAGTGLSLVGNTFSLTSPVSPTLGGTGTTTSPASGQFLYSSGGTTYAPTTLSSQAVTTFSAGTTGLTPNSATSGAITLAGTLVAVNGGTGQSSYAVGDILYASTTTALSKLADVATGNALISGGVNTAPSWGKIGLTTHVSGILPLANGGTNAALTAVNGGVVYSSGTAMAITAAGTSGQYLRSNGAAAPTWVTLTNGGLQLYAENPSTPTAPSATGTNAVAIGSGASASATNAVAIGSGTAANVANIFAYANGSFATAGDAQDIKVVARTITTNATPGVLFIDGSSQRLVLPNNSAWTFYIKVVARRTDTTGGWAMYTFEGGILRDANAASTNLVRRSRTIIDESNGAWNCDVTADTTNGALQISVTGEAGKTIRWVATVEITQVTN